MRHVKLFLIALVIAVSIWFTVIGLASASDVVFPLIGASTQGAADTMILPVPGSYTVRVQAPLRS